jgi:hypothetical protein
MDGAVDSLVLPADGAGLMSRECGSCHRVFKVRRGEAEGGAVQRTLARRMAHVNDAEISNFPPERFCPYCGQAAAEDSWLTAEQRALVEKRADHWLRELRYVQLSQPRQTLAQNPNLTYLPVAPEPFPEAAPERTDALRPFPLVCCREQMRISPSWHGPVHCHFCGIEHDLPRVSPGFLERLGNSGIDI